MEELKSLIELVANVPVYVLWILVGYLFYKLAIIGSIYGLIRFAIDKLHNAYIARQNYIDQNRLINPKELACINEQTEVALMKQIRRIRSTGYVHLSDVENLASILDAWESSKKK